MITGFGTRDGKWKNFHPTIFCGVSQETIRSMHMHDLQMTASGVVQYVKCLFVQPLRTSEACFLEPGDQPRTFWRRYILLMRGRGVWNRGDFFAFCIIPKNSPGFVADILKNGNTPGSDSEIASQMLCCTSKAPLPWHPRSGCSGSRGWRWGVQAS
jgi:hypothetical protein